MGFDSKCEFAPPTILLGLLLCPWAWGISPLPLQHLLSCWGFSALGLGLSPHGCCFQPWYLLSATHCSTSEICRLLHLPSFIAKVHPRICCFSLRYDSCTIQLTLRKVWVGDLNTDCHIVPPPSGSSVLSTAKTVSLLELMFSVTTLS